MSTQQGRVYNGRYELNRHIARGGMAEVYLAHDLLLDRPVALKVLFPELSVDLSFVERFRREAQAAANLSHQNIVSIFDWGEEEGTYFIVMEYVSGQPLSHVIRTEGRLEPVRAAQIAAGTAAALSNAHRNGVIHRDVKPGNILLDEQGQVKVTDFGIARAGDPKENLTQTGIVMGTATYFSPEQAQGYPTDARTDVYSLGVVLYEMVTGRPPFTGDTPVSIAYQHVKAIPVAPRVVEPSVSEDFEAIILAAMEKDRENRYPSADELRSDLIRFARGQTPKAVRVLQLRGALPVPAGIEADPTVAVPAATVAFRPDTPPLPPAQNPPAVSAAPAGEPRPPRTGLFVGISLGLLGVLLLLLFVLARLLGFGGGDNQATKVTVDSVVNETFDAAERILTAQGFVVVRKDQPNDEIESGTVVDQDPKGGAQAAQGSPVEVFVAVATGMVDTPGLVNLQQEEAESTLRAAGLVPVVQLLKNASVGEGFVFEQSPLPKTSVAKGSQVTIRVSTGDGLPPVPDVVGLSALEATNRLSTAGFKTRNVEENSPTVTAGSVTRTDPSAGSRFSRGETTVTVYVSRGAVTTTVAKVAVPSVVGLDRATAESRLSAAGLTVSVETTSGGTPGRVKAQTPSSGTRVDPGSTVTITVGAASSSTTSSTIGGSTSSTAPSTTAPLVTI